MGEVVVLCSGGVDSQGLLAMAGDELALVVFCSYGQPAGVQEYWAAKAAAQRHGARFVNLPLTTLYTKAMKAPAGEPGPRIVPARNAVFVAHAANLAASIDASEVWLGAIADDAEYPDCSVAFCEAMTLATGVAIRAPLVEMTKLEVVAAARRLDVPLNDCWSCYAPNELGEPCGACDSCVLLLTASASLE